MSRKNYIYNIAWGKTENFLTEFTIQKDPKKMGNFNKGCKEQRCESIPGRIIGLLWVSLFFNRFIAYVNNFISLK